MYAQCTCFVLNYFSSPLQSKATFKSEFYISNLASAFMSTDTFSSTDPITKNTKEENYKVHNKIRLSLLQLLLLLHPLAPPCRVINSSQTSSCKAEPPHGFLLCVVEGKEKGHLLPVVVVFDHLQAGCLMLLFQPVLRDTTTTTTVSDYSMTKF